MAGVLLDVAQVVQPQPHRNPGGDCFACALQAALGHLFPEKPVGFEQTDRWFTGEWATLADGTKPDRPPPTSNTWPGMVKALSLARSDGWPIEWQIEQAMHPSIDVSEWGPGWQGFDDARGYARRLEAWLAAGWVAITNVLFDGSGPLTIDLKLRGPDHFVVLDGVRERVDDPYWNNPEIHVVCSARGTYWINTMTWQRGHGALSWLLVRRSA